MSKELNWKRYKGNPVFPAEPGSWMESQTANPDILLIKDTYVMYFRGQQGGHDRIGLAAIGRDRFNGGSWMVYPDPVIDVGSEGDPDETHALDPASAYVNGKVYLYYSGVSPECDRSVCLATSGDGIHFEKHKDNPILIGGCPEIVYKDGIFHLFHWKEKKNGSGFQIHLSTSEDGYNFKEYQPDPVLSVGPVGMWDSHTVETPRIFEEDGLYYMMYCGSDRYDDYPWNAGLATSKDLINWEKYRNNPVFSRGDEGSWDEGAIWFTTVEKIEGLYYMWYEGYGGGTARTEPYGSYLEGGKTQIGLAELEADYFYVKP